MNLQPPHTPGFEAPVKAIAGEIQSQSGHPWHLIVPFCAMSSGSTSGDRSGTQGVSLLLFFSPEKDDTKNRFTTLAERFSTSPSTSQSPVSQMHLLVLNPPPHPSYPAFPITPSRRLKKKCAFNFNSHVILLKAHRGGGHASQQRR